MQGLAEKSIVHQDVFDVFVSYSTEDRTLVDALVHFLEEKKIRCRYADRDFIGGVSYSDQIVNSIQEAQIVLFVLSEHSSGSEPCKRELEIAASFGRIIIPYKVDGAVLEGGIGYYLQNIHWINAFPDPEKYFEKLAMQINGMLQADRKVLATVSDGEPVDGKESQSTDSRDRFLRWLCQLRSKQMCVLVSSIESPTMAMLIAESRKVYSDLLASLEEERLKPASFEQFNSVCEMLSEVLERGIELNDASFELNGAMACAVEMLCRFPRGPIGRFSEEESDLMVAKVQKVFDLLNVIGEDILKVAEACHVSFELPLMITALPRGVGLKEALFVHEGDAYRYKRTLFGALYEISSGVNKAMSMVPDEMPVALVFDPQVMYIQLRTAMNGGQTLPSAPERIHEELESAMRENPSVRKELENACEQAVSHIERKSE